MLLQPRLRARFAGLAGGLALLDGPAGRVVGTLECRGPGALIAIEEAVTTYRQLAAANPAAFTPDLAASLNNLGNRRSEVGDRPGALIAIEEAVTTYRQLAAANPAAFTPDLATSIDNMAALRSEVGDRAGALTTIQEAVALLQGLAAANPGAFAADLGMALTQIRW